MKRLRLIFINFFLMLGLLLLLNSAASCQQEIFRSDWPDSMKASSCQCAGDSVRTVRIQWWLPVHGINSYTVLWAKEDTMKFHDLPRVDTTSCVIKNKFKLGEQYLLRVWYRDSQGRRVYGKWYELSCMHIEARKQIRAGGFFFSLGALGEGFRNALRDISGFLVIFTLIAVFSWGLTKPRKRPDQREKYRTYELTLGLFGTLIGLIIAFRQVKERAIQNPLPQELLKVLSGGVYTALITTILGLLFMILLLLLPRLSRLKGIVSGIFIVFFGAIVFLKLYWWLGIILLCILGILWLSPILSKIKLPKFRVKVER